MLLLKRGPKVGYSTPCLRITGRPGEVEDLKYEGDGNEPIILYFHSDGSMEGTGFKFTYSYHDIDETSIFWTANQVQNTYGKLSNVTDSHKREKKNGETPRFCFSCYPVM